MIVISNSSPLIALSRIDRLDILKQLFGKVFIPDAVYQETVVNCAIPIRRHLCAVLSMTSLSWFTQLSTVYFQEIWEQVNRRS